MEATAPNGRPAGIPRRAVHPSGGLVRDEKWGATTAGHLDYALSRSFWAKQHPPTPTEEDGETLCNLVLERLPHDLGVIDAGSDPDALRTNRTPKFLRQ
jgi:hypothetical protein